MSSNNSNKGVIMATYECPKCEMSVNATCCLLYTSDAADE